jgi:beta-galactosidase
MRRLFTSLSWFLLATTLPTAPLHAAERIPLLADWEFRLDEPVRAADGRSPDRGWRLVTLPHDWSIELPTDPDAVTGGGGGYFPAATGWYRKTFDASSKWRGQELAIYFEGVYRNAEAWLNGSRLGDHAYGYTPFRFSITRHLRFDRPNELLVRVANDPQPNSRWYTGSGIYRPIWLEVRPVVHFVPESVFATTRTLSDDEANLNVSASIANADRLAGGEQVEFTLIGPDGAEAASAAVEFDHRNASTARVASNLTVRDPLAWTPGTPRLYTLRASLRRGAEIVEDSEHSIGLRMLQWSSQRGFELNGRPIEFFGGNVHHDHGPLGAAAYPEAEWRKVGILKSAGFNAVRTAHNPPSEAFLYACDRLGLLVIDEAFDGWKSGKTDHDYARIFDGNWRKDLRAMVLRDRNHPSVVMWSIGNEVYERGEDSGIERAHAMAAVIRQLDRSRPITIGLNGLGETDDWTRLDGIFDALDVSGYNYELARHAEDHRRRPNRVVYASESYQTDAFTNWRIARENAYVIGDFVWSALDYLGEAGIGRIFPPDEEARAHWIGEHYPWHGAFSGDIDLIGSRKPISHYRNIVWNRGETLYAAVLEPTPDGRPWNLTKWSVQPALASWTWPGREGRELILEVYSRHPSVRVVLNGELIGEAPTTEAEAFKARFTVPYQPGRLEVVGGPESFILETAKVPSRLRFVEPDSMHAGGDSRRLYFAVVEIQDVNGTWHPDADRPVEFSVTGGGRIVAVGSGDLASTESYRENPRRSHRGRGLVVFEVDADSGSRIVLRAEADGLEPALLRVR